MKITDVAIKIGNNFIFKNYPEYSLSTLAISELVDLKNNAREESVELRYSFDNWKNSEDIIFNCSWKFVNEQGTLKVSAFKNTVNLLNENYDLSNIPQSLYNILKN
ncbi:MAG: hypothetical protein F6K35_03760 [Okeania sp. SIO2H7]|nr:hypothetical protein [Okeania sp. SIO2H7]